MRSYFSELTLALPFVACTLACGGRVGEAGGSSLGGTGGLAGSPSGGRSSTQDMLGGAGSGGDRGTFEGQFQEPIPSATQFCAAVDYRNLQATRPSIAVDTRGVFVLETGGPAVVQQLTSGHWSRFWESEPGYTSTGAKVVSDGAGSLFIHSLLPCEIVRIDEQARLFCSGATSTVDFLAIHSSLGYAVGYSGLLRYDNGVWYFLQEPTPQPELSFWSDGDTFLIGTVQGIYSGNRDSGYALEVALPKLPYSAVWGSEAARWAVTDKGHVYRKDEKAWGPIGSVGELCGKPRGATGAGGQIIVYDKKRLVTVDLQGREHLLDGFPCESPREIVSVASGGDGSIYYLVVNPEEASDSCNYIEVRKLQVAGPGADALPTRL